MTDLDELERLLAKATPGEWEWDAGIIPPDGPGHYADIYVMGEDREPTILMEFNDSLPEGRINAALTVALRNAAPALIAELKALREEVSAKRHAIDRDRYIVAAVLQEIRKAVNGHRWLIDSRGPYEWDDDRYRDEFSDWLDNVEAASESLAQLAWDKSHSETDPDRVIAAKYAAKDFLLKKRPLKRVALPSDIGLPCPTCKQMPEYFRNAALSDLIASTADEYDPQAIAKETPDAG